MKGRETCRSLPEPPGAFRSLQEISLCSFFSKVLSGPCPVSIFRSLFVSLQQPDSSKTLFRLNPHHVYIPPYLALCLKPSAKTNALLVGNFHMFETRKENKGAKSCGHIPGRGAAALCDITKRRERGVSSGRVSANLVASHFWLLKFV